MFLEVREILSRKEGHVNIGVENLRLRVYNHPCISKPNLEQASATESDHLPQCHSSVLDNAPKDSTKSNFS